MVLARLLPAHRRVSDGHGVATVPHRDGERRGDAQRTAHHGGAHDGRGLCQFPDVPLCHRHVGRARLATLAGRRQCPVGLVRALFRPGSGAGLGALPTERDRRCHCLGRSDSPGRAGHRNNTQRGLRHLSAPHQGTVQQGGLRQSHHRHREWTEGTLPGCGQRHRLPVRLQGVTDLVLPALGKGDRASDPLRCADPLSL